MISTPISASPRANSATPRLSDTVIRARCTRTSPAAEISTSGTARTSLIDDHPTRIGGVERDFPPGYQTDRSRQQFVLDLVHVLLDYGDVPRIGKLERSLEDDRPTVDAFVDEMHGHPRHLDAVLERLLDRVDAGERREQGGVDVHDREREAGDEPGAEQLHEPGKHD